MDCVLYAEFEYHGETMQAKVIGKDVKCTADLRDIRKFLIEDLVDSLGVSLDSVKEISSDEYEED